MTLKLRDYQTLLEFWLQSIALIAAKVTLDNSALHAFEFLVLAKYKLRNKPLGIFLSQIHVYVFTTATF